MKYKTIKNAFKKATNYITFSDIVVGRFNHMKKGYTDLKIDDIDLTGLLTVVGGRLDYSLYIEHTINNKINYGIFDRLIYNGERWRYVAGQDYTVEINTIRKLLRGV